jgi:fimbrial chaperone protein
MRALIGLLAASTLLAGSFRVSPVRIDLSAHKPHTTVQVTNIGADRVTLQVDAYSWHFAEGEDRLVDSDDILVNPPVFTLEPGASQVLRLGLREYTPANAETPYRVILEEVPPPQRSGVNGIVTLLRVSIPLFVQSSQRGTSDLVWSAVRQTDERMVLTVENRGTQHARLSQFQVLADEKTAFSVSMPTYVLPGTRRDWTIDGTPVPPSGELHIRAKTEEKDLNATAMVGAR